MSALTKEDLVGNLIWSKQSFTLADLTAKYSLPQIIRVRQGYDGGSESTSLGFGEVLILHALRTTQRITADDNSGHGITIALDCPYQLQILPKYKDWNLAHCGMKDLSSLYPKIKYFQVVRAHYGTGNDEDSTTVGELLEIIQVDKKHKKAKVKSVETGQTFSLPFASAAEFKPLLDWRTFSVKELKDQFGFPTRVHFLVPENKTSRSAHVDESEKFILKRTIVTLVEEIEEVFVIATTIGDELESTFCYEIPKDLQVRVEIAEGFLTGEGDYQKVVMNLNNAFDVSNFIKSQKSNFVHRRNSMKQHDYESIKGLLKNYQKSGKELPGPRAIPPKPSKIQRLKSAKDNKTTKPKIPPKPPTTKKRSDSAPVELAYVTPIDPAPQDVQVIPSKVTRAKKPNQSQGVLVLPPCKAPAFNSEDSSDYDVVLHRRLSTVHVSPTNVKKVAKLPPRTKIPFGQSSDSTTKSPDLPSSPTEIPQDARVTYLGSKPNAPHVPERSKLSSAKAPGCEANKSGHESATTPKLPSRPASQKKCKTTRIDRSDEFHTPLEPQAKHDPQETKGNYSGTDVVHQSADNTYEELNFQRSTDENSIYTPLQGPQDSSVGHVHGHHDNSKAVRSPSSEATRELQISRMPDDLSSLSIAEVGELLSDLGIGCYIATFEEEMIDGKLLQSLSEDELESLNMSAFHVKKLVRFLKGWRPKYT